MIVCFHPPSECSHWTRFAVSLYLSVYLSSPASLRLSTWPGFLGLSVYLLICGPVFLSTIYMLPCVYVHLHVCICTYSKPSGGGRFLRKAVAVVFVWVLCVASSVSGLLSCGQGLVT